MKNKDKARLVKYAVKYAKQDIKTLEGVGVFSTKYYNHILEEMSVKYYELLERELNEVAN